MSKQTGSFDLNSCSEDLETWPFRGFRVIGQLSLILSLIVLLVFLLCVDVSSAILLGSPDSKHFARNDVDTTSSNLCDIFLIFRHFSTVTLTIQNSLIFEI